MTKLFILILSICLSPLLHSQIQKNSEIGNKRGPCFQKSLDRLGQRYIEWDCNESNGIIDCNEKLESNPNSKAVFVQATGRPFTGDCVTCHENGLRERLVHFENGIVNGIDTTYYKSGCPQVVRSHIQGIENGKWVYYNDTSGLMAWEINYKNGVKHGEAIYYRQHKIGKENLKYTVNGVEKSISYNTYENDTIKIENYKDGIINGIKREFHWPGSKPKLIIHYKDGVFDGTFTEYNENGDILQERNYIKGVREGTWTFYYNNGNLLRTETWRKDVKDGEIKTFFIQGELQSLESYKKGMKDGQFLTYFPDQKIKRSAVYKNDKLIEEHIFDSHGVETKTFSLKKSKKKSNKKTEDDELPSTGRKKNKKAKKVKKEKKKKEEKDSKQEE